MGKFTPAEGFQTKRQRLVEMCKKNAFVASALGSSELDFTDSNFHFQV